MKPDQLKGWEPREDKMTADKNIEDALKEFDTCWQWKAGELEFQPGLAAHYFARHHAVIKAVLQNAGGRDEVVVDALKGIVSYFNNSEDHYLPVVIKAREALAKVDGNDTLK